MHPEEIGVSIDDVHIITDRTCLKILARAVSNFDELEIYSTTQSGRPTVLWKGSILSSTMSYNEYSNHAGKMFEKVCTDNAEDGSDVSAGRYMAIIRRMFGDSTVLFSSDVDCYDKMTDVQNGSASHFANLRTVKESRWEHEHSSFHESEAHALWIETFLTGVESTIFGCCNSNGKLSAIEKRASSMQA